MAALVDISRLEVIRGNNRVLKNVDFKLKNGEIAVITGKNGSGKTTLLRCIYGLVKPHSGSVSVLSQPVEALRPAQLGSLRREISYLEQFSAPAMPHFTVRTILTSALEACGFKDKKDNDSRAEATAERLGLSGKMDSAALQLSAGQLQMLIIGRAIITKPKLLLADMPFNNLSPEKAEFVTDLLNNLATEGTGILLTSFTPDIPGLNISALYNCAERTLTRAN